MAPLLPDREPLSWSDVQAATETARQRAVDELLFHWPVWTRRRGDALLWGDEVEQMVVVFDEEKRRAPLSLAQDRILASLDALQAAQTSASEQTHFPSFQPEYARYMVESSPSHPYDASPAGLCDVESNMRRRRKLIQACLAPKEKVITLATYPLLGASLTPSAGGTTGGHVAFDGLDEASLHGPILDSSLLPDEIISPFHRYRTLTANTRNRKGAKPDVHVPLFIDSFTHNRWEPHPDEDPSHPDYRQRIYMDALPFGTGCCGLQATVQASSLAQAREMHDLLVPLSPIFLALTAASPAFRGALADTDSRWSVLVQACDDRTPLEMPTDDRPAHQRPRASGAAGLIDGKSRWDTVGMYLALPPDLEGKKEFQPVHPLLVHQPSYERLFQGGMDPLLARHFAHIFHHDPLLLYPDPPASSGASHGTEYLDRFLTTTWPAVRLKPPLSADGPGWRVEFRSMEVQLTDFENAAFTIFVVLLVETLVRLGVDARMPLTAVDENMDQAQRRDAVSSAQFTFSTSFARCLGALPDGGPDDGLSSFSLNELINGKPDGFKGLVPFVRSYLATSKPGMTAAQAAQLGGYLDFISQRAQGHLLTPATYMREYIQRHPDYHFDSHISPELGHDLLLHLCRVEQGIISAPRLLLPSYTPFMEHATIYHSAVKRHNEMESEAKL